MIFFILKFIELWNVCYLKKLTKNFFFILQISQKHNDILFLIYRAFFDIFSKYIFPLVFVFFSPYSSSLGYRIRAFRLNCFGALFWNIWIKVLVFGFFLKSVLKLVKKCWLFFFFFKNNLESFAFFLEIFSWGSKLVYLYICRKFDCFLNFVFQGGRDFLRDFCNLLPGFRFYPLFNSLFNFSLP